MSRGPRGPKLSEPPQDHKSHGAARLAARRAAGLCAYRRAADGRAATPQADDELPTPAEIEVEFQDLYRHDEEQAYLTLMSQEIKSINFPCEENYTVRLCVRRGSDAPPSP